MWFFLSLLRLSSISLTLEKKLEGFSGSCRWKTCEMVNWKFLFCYLLNFLSAKDVSVFKSFAPLLLGLKFPNKLTWQKFLNTSLMLFRLASSNFLCFCFRSISIEPSAANKQTQLYQHIELNNDTFHPLHRNYWSKHVALCPGPFQRMMKLIIDESLVKRKKKFFLSPPVAGSLWETLPTVEITLASHSHQFINIKHGLIEE